MADQQFAAGSRTVLWQANWFPGTEWCELSDAGDSRRITGIVLASVSGAPMQIRYEVLLDAAWATREVDIVVLANGGSQEHRLRLVASQDRLWQIARATMSDPTDDALDVMRGLFDVDLGFSPSTNILPIRRLDPAIGESVDVTAVWVRFPELTVEPLPQRYTRLDERRYRYESNGGAFVAEITVDDLGLVITYEGGWQRIAESDR